MARKNINRNSCKDVFNAFLVKNANYDGEEEIPYINGTVQFPNKLISFSKCLSSKDYNQWVMFYEDDSAFERIWRNPIKYLEILKRFNGVISPDFSLYRDMPLVMQKWNTYRNRAIGHWFEENDIKVIPNVRFGDERTYDFCTLGIKHNSIIAIGTHGLIKVKEDREYLIQGLEFVINKINPTAIVVYGKAPDSIFLKYKNHGIEILQFESEFGQTHRKEVRIMGTGNYGGFDNTKGAKNTSSKSTLNNNIKNTQKIYPLTAGGYFGQKGKNTRVIETDNPILESKRFCRLIGKGGKIDKLNNNKGIKITLDDGTIISYRIITKTKNSPAIEINIKKCIEKTKVKTQKIHFIRRER